MTPPPARSRARAADHALAAGTAAPSVRAGHRAILASGPLTQPCGSRRPLRPEIARGQHLRARELDLDLGRRIRIRAGAHDRVATADEVAELRHPDERG